MLEGSKIFAKEFMDRHGIPTARFSVHDDVDSACAEVRRRGGKCVIKADGLAAGKGVFVCTQVGEAEKAVREILKKNVFGDAGKRILIEDLLEGEEASVLAICDGKNFVPLVAAQDHKAAFEGDLGPNTGGMGSYAPAPIVGPDIMDVVKEQVLKKAVEGMSSDGVPFKGLLYAGIMICDGKPSVLEFNVRFGDPETQPLMALMKEDIVPLLVSASEGELSKKEVEWNRGASMCVVLASEGYPGSYEKGKVISGLDEAALVPGVTVFHAGTKNEGGKYLTSGGRVLGVTALGSDLSDAAKAAYNAASKINWEGMRMRRDIGHRAL
jgi:phosphoribosylamine--glycine ligase